MASLLTCSLSLFSVRHSLRGTTIYSHSPSLSYSSYPHLRPPFTASTPSARRLILAFRGCGEAHTKTPRCIRSPNSLQALASTSPGECPPPETPTNGVDCYSWG